MFKFTFKFMLTFTSEFLLEIISWVPDRKLKFGMLLTKT